MVLNFGKFATEINIIDHIRPISKNHPEKYHTWNESHPFKEVQNNSTHQYIIWKVVWKRRRKKNRIV